MSELPDIHIHIHFDQGTPDPLVEEMHAMVTQLTQGAQQMATDLTALTAAVEQTTSVSQSVIALLDGLKQQLDDAGTDPAALAALSDSLSSNSQALSDAVTRNTPAASTP